jgi:hypothetical protein
VPAGTFTELCARTAQVTRLLTGYLVYLDRQIAERDSASAASAPAPNSSSLGSARAPA